MELWQLIALALLGVHLARVQIRRHSLFREIHDRYGSRYFISSTGENAGKARMIDSYKGVRDAQRIVRLSASMDTPFIFTKALEFSLFRTYGIPTISSLLLHTGQLGKAENAGRRYVDTSGLIQAYMTYPVPRNGLPDGGESSTKVQGWESFGEDPSDPRSAISIARVNFLHGRWKSKISNDDLLYTLSTFVIEPTKWIDRYEWRRLSALENEALFALFYHIGKCLGIKDIPETRDELVEWSQEYEKNYMVFTQSNHEVAEHTTNLLLYSLPKPLHGFARNLVISLMDDRLRKAMGYPPAPSWIVTFKDTLFKIRATLIRHLFLPRSKPLTNIPIGADEAGNVFSVEHLLQQGIPNVCPMSGARAEHGKKCPVGDHSVPTLATAEGDFKPAAWRMELNWYENEPVYARPYSRGSAAWVAEEIKIALGLMKKEDRRGAAKWLPPTLPKPETVKGKEGGKKEVVQGFGGFRLEEMGPKGLEMKGRKEVMEAAEKLYGGKLEGKWAFDP